MIYYTLNNDATELTVHDSYDLGDYDTQRLGLDVDDVKCMIDTLTEYLGEMKVDEAKHEIRALKNERARIESRLAQLGAL